MGYCIHRKGAEIAKGYDIFAFLLRRQKGKSYTPANFCRRQIKFSFAVYLNGK